MKIKTENRGDTYKNISRRMLNEDMRARGMTRVKSEIRLRISGEVQTMKIKTGG